MTGSNSFSIYAELLLNIRQISVVASLPSARDASTSATVFAEGSRLGVRHAGASRDIALPGKVVSGPVLPIPKDGDAQTLTWRLALAPSHPSSVPVSHDHYPMPWTALDMQPGAAISCRNCKNVVVASGLIKAWKDLPSENWAEMMEFWHCHKPEEPEGHQPKDHDHLTTRGYGANHAMSAQQGVGFVDLTSFLVSESDTSGLKYAEATNTTPHPAADGGSSRILSSVSCSECTCFIGFHQDQKSSISLFKWQVDCATVEPSRAPTPTDCLGAILAATISRSGSSKSVVLPVPHSLVPAVEEGTSGSATALPSAKARSKALHAWVLNSHIMYTSTETAEPKTAIKLLYKIIGVEEAETLAESVASGVQELSLVDDALAACLLSLETSNGFLPVKQRVYKEWSVGLLDRYDS